MNEEPATAPLAADGPLDGDPGLQPERTALAWGRTVLTLIAASAVCLRWLPDQGPFVLAMFGLTVAAGKILGAISLEDAARTESRQAVAALQDRGIQVAMITGDARQVAQAVADELNIDEVFAEVLPADKDKKVSELQGRGFKVAMVGDGRKMWQNLVWATGYNVISVPLAAGVLAFAGVTLSPAAGAVLMSVSTIVVALNTQLLRRVKLNPSPSLRQSPWPAAAADPAAAPPRPTRDDG